MVRRILPAGALWLAMAGCGARSELDLDPAPWTVDASTPDAALPNSGIDASAPADAMPLDAMPPRDATMFDVGTMDAPPDATADANDGGSDAADASPETDASDAFDAGCPLTGFGPNGVEQLPEPPAPYLGNSATMAVQPDGKIVIAGSPTSGWTSTLVVTRYNADGTPDTTFGTSGVVTLTPPTAVNIALAVALQPDGKILVSGCGDAAPYSPVSYVARLSVAGVLDASYGANGYAKPSDGATRLWSLLPLPDGSTLGIGDENVGGIQWVVYLTRFTSTGPVDTSFGSNGITTTTMPSDGSGERAIVQPDGKVVVGINTYGDTNIPYLARYTSNGFLDSSFGNGGVALATPVAANHNFVVSLGMQSTGGIVFVRQAVEANPDEMTLCRFTAAGAADTTFGLNGSMTMPFYAQASLDVVVLPNDALLLGGTMQEPGEQDLALARYTPNGALDTTFASGGMQIVTFPGETENNLVSMVLGPGGVVIDGTGTKPTAGCGAAGPVLDLGLFGGL